MAGKGALAVVGAVIVVFGIAFLPLAKVAMLALMGAGAGYFGYRALAKSKMLGGGKAPKALNSAGDFDRKMRELDEMDRRLDAEIRKRS